MKTVKTKGKNSSEKKILKKSFSNYRNIIIFLLCIFAASFLLYRQWKSCFDRVDEKTKKIALIIEKINDDCKIEKFSNKLNSIDFLNIKEFSGNSIGTLHLAKPENWKGPYLNDLLTYKEKPFNLLDNVNGYYIVPGNEVVMDDGCEIGKDIIFDDQCNVEKNNS